MGLFAEEVFDDFLHLWHARHAANQDHFVDIASLQARILQRLFAWLNGLLNEIIHQRLKFRAGELQRQMLWTRGISRDVGQVDFGLGGRGQLDLRLFSGFFEALKGELVLFEINALLFLELVCQIFNEPHIEIFAAKERIAIG